MKRLFIVERTKSNNFKKKNTKNKYSKIYYRITNMCTRNYLVNCDFKNSLVATVNKKKI